jgi:hypothetical protein
MIDSIQLQLEEYYLHNNIHPEHFDCRHKAFCRQHAHQQDMTEAKMSMVGSRYGAEYPRIVVVSLDPPYGNRGEGVELYKLTTAYISASHETDDYSVNRPNVHWALTQIIVKDILSLFGYSAQPGAAEVSKSYAGRPIENVTPYFAHVNVAKCSMNNPGKGQAHRKVHETCGGSYLKGELALLAPEILLSQGNAANSVVAELLNCGTFAAHDLPAAKSVDVDGTTTLWLPMRHPARQLARIRREWHFYVENLMKARNPRSSLL